MTADQRTQALKIANATRRACARTKREIAMSGKLGAEAYAADLFLNSDGQPESALTVGAVLRAIPGWGEVKVAVAVRKADVQRSRRLRELTDRQRAALAEQVGA